MGVSALILDRSLGCADTCGRPYSVLRAPTPLGVVAATLVEQLHACDITDVFVCPPPDAAESYARELEAAAPGVAVLDDDTLARRLAHAEPADAWLLVDARHVGPRQNHYRHLTQNASRQLGAAHLVALMSPDGGTLERVVLDSSGALVRFERVFHGVTHFHGPVVAATLAAAATLRILPRAALADLSTLRAALAGAGVPNRDVPLSGGFIDLLAHNGLVELCEHLSGEFAREITASNGRDADRRVAPDATVDPACRIVGPVAVHSGASVAAGALIVGPAVIGPRARIESGAVVSRSVVLDGMVVRAGESAVNAVCGARRGAAADGAASLWARTRQVGADDTPHRSPMGFAARAVKRGLDIALSLLGLITLSPLFLLVAVLIKLTSRGPVFFAHEREGRGGRPFRCIKFRTMVQRAHAMQRRLYEVNNVDGPQFKMDNDPRVTWVGHYLRRANIDELPQLINVLLGDMSLIGPRPSPFRENQICMPWRATRLSVRPGVTGLWQICRSEREYGDFHQWIYYDIQYVQNQSLWLDVLIMLATGVTLGGRWSVPDRWLIGSTAAINRAPRVHRRPRADGSPVPRAIDAARGAPGAPSPDTAAGAAAWPGAGRESRQAAG